MRGCNVTKCMYLNTILRYFYSNITREFLFTATLYFHSITFLRQILYFCSSTFLWWLRSGEYAECSSTFVNHLLWLFSTMKSVKIDWWSNLRSNILLDLFTVQLSSPEISEHDPTKAVMLWQEQEARLHGLCKEGRDWGIWLGGLSW